MGHTASSKALWGCFQGSGLIWGMPFVFEQWWLLEEEWGGEEHTVASAAGRSMQHPQPSAASVWRLRFIPRLLQAGLDCHALCGMGGTPGSQPPRRVWYRPSQCLGGESMREGVNMFEGCCTLSHALVTAPNCAFWMCRGTRGRPICPL